LAAIKSENVPTIKSENVPLAVKEELKTSALGVTQSAPAEVRKNGTDIGVKDEVPVVDRSRSRSREGKKEKKKDYHRHHHSSSSESDYHRHRHKDSKKDSKRDSKRDKDSKKDSKRDKKDSKRDKHHRKGRSGSSASAHSDHYKGKDVPAIKKEETSTSTNAAPVVSGEAEDGEIQ
jgi:hypothetical protein